MLYYSPAECLIVIFLNTIYQFNELPCRNDKLCFKMYLTLFNHKNSIDRSIWKLRCISIIMISYIALIQMMTNELSRTMHTSKLNQSEQMILFLSMNGDTHLHMHIWISMERSTACEKHMYYVQVCILDYLLFFVLFGARRALSHILYHRVNALLSLN